MSDYISKSALKEEIKKQKDDNDMHCRLCMDAMIEIVEELPTLDEKEIIRKAFERVVEILKHRELEHCANRNQARRSGFYTMVEFHQRRSEECQEIIKIIKEECGINE